MDLEGTTVRVIDDAEAPEVWPRHLRLAGFVIQQTHGQGVPLGEGFTDRPVWWYLDWLGREESFTREDTFTREPYTLLETLLRTVGRNRDADRIAMARMDHEYMHEGIVHHTVGRAYSSIVGYGYRPERAIFWVVGLILIGWLVLIAWSIAEKHIWGVADDHLLTSNLNKNGVTSRFMLSAQRLIPLITFGKGYEDVDLTSKAVPWWVRWYFYVHAVLGYILAAFLLTALAKITTT
jgi:hypothetical protein